MNLAFYGHSATEILTGSLGGKYYSTAFMGGARRVREIVEFGTANAPALRFNFSADINSEEYRRDYYEGSFYEIKEGSWVLKLAAYRYLGYQDGQTSHNLYYAPPKNPDAPVDILTVLDEGYGGLDLPDTDSCLSVVWASSKAMPDRAQFGKIAQKCFLMLDADVLRKAGGMISRQISWERTASDLVAELQTNPALSYLLDAKYIFITFSHDGGFLAVSGANRGSPRFDASLMLTHGGAEGTISEKLKGELPGLFSMLVGCLVNAIALMPESYGVAEQLKSSGAAPIDFMVSVLMANSEEEQPTAALLGGSLRQLLETSEALALAPIDIETNDATVMLKIKNWPAFSIPLFRKGGHSVPTLFVPPLWAVTENVGNKQIFDVASEYVQKGAEVIDGLPQLSFGAFTTIDRWEIEAYQNIRNLILDYVAASAARPLSIAAFGSPGSGKSFGVTQIAENILPGKVKKLEFNVSQFVNAMDLGAAFQKVRDVILENKLPLVFFDEFDSENLVWLKSFLMPMQDGRFRDESGEHPLGKCILVFAGGTSPSFESFIAPMASTDPVVKKNFASIKGPDFISRLKGTINVLGPNPRDDEDKNYILRRALLLRSLCVRNLAMKDNIAPISPNIIRAMLMVPEFRHGARSMEAIMDMSRLTGGTWEPASLPFHSQLALHVDADAFLELLRQ